jgi:hypothetical protein
MCSQFQLAGSLSPPAFSVSNQITIPTPTLTAPLVGPSNIGQYDDINVAWTSTNLGAKAPLWAYRCSEVTDATVDCSTNSKCVLLDLDVTNSGFAKLSSEQNDVYTEHVDDAYLYNPGWTTDVGTFFMCLSAPQPTGAPVFQYSTSYKVSSSSLKLMKPDADSCFVPFETATVKWDSVGGGESVDLFKCKSKSSLSCESHPDCNPVRIVVDNLFLCDKSTACL